jgi:D-arabinose 1-dehydrogenase-like Zn-dependent alcohol dehydrogenase
MQLDIVASVLVCGLVAYATLRYSGISASRAIVGLIVAVVGLGGLALILMQGQTLTPQDILSIRNTAVGAIVGLIAGSTMAMKRAKNPD